MKKIKPAIILCSLILLVLFGLFITFIKLFFEASVESSHVEQRNQRSSQPNMIFVLVDDQRFDALGRLNPAIKTPVMDQMANDGVFFENSFVTTSLCSPSRATILTGMSTRNHGIVGNSEAERPGTVYFPKYLQDAGYQTALIGKWHMGHGGHQRKGFDHWVSFSGQGHYWPKDAPDGQSILNVNGKEVEQKGYITDELTDYAIDWINQARTDGKPFFMHLAHKAVHANFSPPERYLNEYDDVTFPQPGSMANTPGNYKGKPQWLKDQRNSVIGVDYAYYSSIDLDELQKRYYAALLAVDDSIGRIIDHLKETGLADNTVVFVMGDNGFIFGEFGLIDKRVAYEPSMRVPLLAWGPKVISSSTTVSEVVANLDIAPTMLGLAGAPVPDYFEGQDMSQLLKKGSDLDWNNEFIYEYYWDYLHPQTPTTFAIRTDQYKLITYQGVWDTEELYDMKNDSKETTNLIWQEEHKPTVAALRRRLYDAIRNSEGNRILPFENKKTQGKIYRYEDGAEPGKFPTEFTRGAFKDNPTQSRNPPAARGHKY